jgi:hypothetical protein
LYKGRNIKILKFKGDECKFRHSEDSLGTTSVCKYWKTKECNDEKCPFRHTITPNCFFFSLGTCTKGGNCPFLHLIPKDENIETKESGTSKSEKCFIFNNFLRCIVF